MPASAPKAFASDVNSIFSSNAKLLLTSTLSHWSIEHSVYWVLDGDDSRIRQVHAQHNLAVLRHMAFNLLRRENSAQIGISAKRKRAGWKTGYLPKILSQQDATTLTPLPVCLDPSNLRPYNPLVTKFTCFSPGGRVYLQYDGQMDAWGVPFLIFTRPGLCRYR